MMSKDNEIVKMNVEFALQIVSYCETLGKRFVVADQLLKAGTSIGANVREVQKAESIVDFLHKMEIAAKEVEETEYGLLICNNAENYLSASGLLPTLNSIQKLLAKIRSSTKKKINKTINH